MKKVILSILAVLFLSNLALAQDPDINPNVQWRFVRSNEINLVTNQLQTFEFPAYRNFHYIVNLEMHTDTVDAEIFIYDMQSKLIASKTFKATSSAQLEFGVFNNATYQVAVRLKYADGTIKPVNTLMSLLKRAKI